MNNLVVLLKRKRALDLLEQVAVSALYFWLTVRLWPSEFTAASWYPLVLLVSEGLVVALLLIRRPTDRISVKTKDWLVAAGGSFLVLTVDKGGVPLSPSLSVTLMLLGLTIHVGAKLSLRRSFGMVAAHRGLKLNGLYTFVRHPMYAGYLLTHVGFLLLAPTLWNLAIYAAAWSCMVARMYAEERVLGEDGEYRAYMERVRYRLLPSVF
jgi:protein-S-isoprenylcysteine O-methyltransferase Ste14